MSKLMIMAIGLMSLYGVCGNLQADKVIHEEKSLYRNIEIKEAQGRRCLVFKVKRRTSRQSCINLDRPKEVVFPYTKMTFAALLLRDKPESVLVIGLGGGTLPKTLNQLYPDATIDAVEIDSAVYRVAQQFFAFEESEQLKVSIADARVFIKRALIRKDSYDLIILDAFTGEYIPEHLMTQEFLQEVKSLLTETGVVVANTFSTSKLYDYESATYKSVFGNFFNFKLPETGNRVIIAGPQPLPSKKVLMSRARRLANRLAPYYINIEDYPRYMSTTSDWDQSVKPMTDQYAPANLLKR
ncbi:MAG: fused MFS/spermidine synthase [Gammaproteobacteria bacterium]|jgi:spermidine synthase|nr:fused MFS/spermidine synthase [Gammaproteobacteria bacterium]MBT5202225.1 fused MFS/spermidine synthase [Gammaproteobacteria bacterium]MBT5600780.1 fused MFS/spermidine synthase [Gammaproteobacteria bacterium]MBT6244799.1 fused MFS/spermidine synthase [Gammaproteobacteria bacterium]